MVAAVLNRPTLVLNRNWQPVGVATVARSLVKVWNDTARIVDPIDYQQYTWADWAKLAPVDEELVVQTQWMRLRVPEVVTLTRYDKLPVNAVTFSRRNVFKRDRFTCQYCGRQGRSVQNALGDNGSRPNQGTSLGEQTGNAGPGGEELTIDHVTPRAQGGVSSWDNCVLACMECNTRKADRTPQQARMKLRKPPSRPLWKPLYASHGMRIDSWSRFVSEAYWNVELEK